MLCGPHTFSGWHIHLLRTTKSEWAKNATQGSRKAAWGPGERMRGVDSGTQTTDSRGAERSEQSLWRLKQVTRSGQRRPTFPPSGTNRPWCGRTCPNPKASTPCTPAKRGPGTRLVEVVRGLVQVDSNTSHHRRTSSPFAVYERVAGQQKGKRRGKYRSGQACARCGEGHCRRARPNHQCRRCWGDFATPAHTPS